MQFLDFYQLCNQMLFYLKLTFFQDSKGSTKWKHHEDLSEDENEPDVYSKKKRKYLQQ